MSLSAPCRTLIGWWWQQRWWWSEETAQRRDWPDAGVTRRIVSGYRSQQIASRVFHHTLGLHGFHGSRHQGRSWDIHKLRLVTYLEMMTLEVLCWIGAASLVIGAWKLMSWLLYMVFSRLGLCSPNPGIIKDMQLQIQKLKAERTRIEEEISQLDQQLRDSSGFSSGIQLPRDVVHVCPKGTCYHTDPHCAYVRDRSTYSLKPCQVCSKKGSEKSTWLCPGCSSDAKWCHCFVSGCCHVESCPQYRILGQFQCVSASCVKTGGLDDQNLEPFFWKLLGQFV